MFLLLVARGVIAAHVQNIRGNPCLMEDSSTLDTFARPPPCAGSLPRALRNAIFQQATHDYEYVVSVLVEERRQRELEFNKIWVAYAGVLNAGAWLPRT